MENTKKVTKKEYFAMVMDIVKASDSNCKGPLVDFLQREIDLLNKKAGSSKDSKEGKANANIMEAVITVLTDIGRPSTVTELLEDIRLKSYVVIDKDGTAETKIMTNQKLTSILKKMLDEKTVAKNMDKKKAYYSLA